MTENMHSPLLSVENLHVSFGRNEREIKAVRGISFTLERGETLALVGESGSGKSVTALSLMQLLPYPHAHHPQGSIKLYGQEDKDSATYEDIIGAPPARLQAIRGDRIAMVFQEPMTSLNPLHSIARQVGETLVLHQGLRGSALRARIIELLTMVGLPDPQKRLNALPHELSGGQRQRVMIAMALANDPDILIADEPTTALDVTIQAQILTLLQNLQKKLGMALLLITHDLSIVRKIAEHVCVMKEGQIVERGLTRDLFTAPQHPYTRHLLEVQPSGRPNPAPPDAPVLLQASDISVTFPIRRNILGRVTDSIKAVDHVSLTIREGHTVGIVGESGSGKTTLGLALLRLLKAKGQIILAGKNISSLQASAMRPLRQSMQVVFQDPFGSLSPRLSIGQIIGEGLDVHAIERDPKTCRTMIGEALREVGLPANVQDRYPHEFSGGQRQRISIARALILKPRFIMLDEPTSALDVSVQAQIVDLLRTLQTRYQLSYMFISHDLRVVRALADFLVVMKDGQIVESGPAQTIFEAPRSAYTRTLLAAAFNLDVKESNAAET